MVQFLIYKSYLFLSNCTESPLALESSNSVSFFFLEHRGPVGFSDILYNFKFNSVSSVRGFCNLIELIAVHAFSEGQWDFSLVILHTGPSPYESKANTSNFGGKDGPVSISCPSTRKEIRTWLYFLCALSKSLNRPCQWNWCLENAKSTLS